MYWGQTIGVSLDLEPSLQAGSLYAYGVIKVGRNAAAFLGNAADKRRMRTALGSVHGIMFPGPLCLRTNHAGSPWAWRNWLSAGAASSRVAAPPILPPRLWYNDGREKCVSMSRERCRRTIGGEQRWAAFMVYCARNHYAMEQTVRVSRLFGTVVIE